MAQLKMTAVDTRNGHANSAPFESRLPFEVRMRQQSAVTTIDIRTGMARVNMPKHQSVTAIRIPDPLIRMATKEHKNKLPPKLTFQIFMMGLSFQHFAVVFIVGQTMSVVRGDMLAVSLSVTL